MEEKFSYNYSADRNEELRKIREKYEIKNDEEQDKLEKIRAMDRKIETPGKVCGIIFGLFFTFIFVGVPFWTIHVSQGFRRFFNL